MTQKSPLDFEKFDNKSFVLRLTVPQKQINDTYLDQLQNIQKTYEAKGFRQGKVPLDVIRQNIPQDKVLEDIAPSLISHLYQHALKDHDLKPIVPPKVKITNPPLTTDKDWQVEITSTELPQVKLDPSYSSKIKKLKIEDKNKLLEEIFKVLVESSLVNLPPVLIEVELEDRLSQLIDELQKVHLTVDQYLKSKQLTPKLFEENLVRNITQEWQLNLAINQIAIDQHLKVDQAEIDQAVKQNPTLASNPHFIHHYLLQQKVVDYLRKLIL